MTAIATLMTCCVAPAAVAENIDPASDGSQHAWSENLGFVNLEPEGGRDGVDVTDTGLTGWAWAENAGWISFSCANTGTCATVSYGVTNDGQGRLAGFAWTENVGWISFSCENTGTCATALYVVAIDPVTGVFSGAAWGESVGWIRFDTASTRAVTSWRAAPPCSEPSALDVRPAAPPLLISRASAGLLNLAFETGTGVREIYQGTLASLHVGRAYNHSSIGVCSIASGDVSIALPALDAYYVVVARCGANESSYGRDSAGRERPPATARCP